MTASQLGGESIDIVARCLLMYVEVELFLGIEGIGFPLETGATHVFLENWDALTPVTVSRDRVLGIMKFS